ncbi:HtaA domain-containing protein [Nocardia sp. bgisy134]|uniref:HtaA domain-containing protein n=1 Tax=Nocardia sp. bgisy134 TaxID=3413789 RepID=UPI003D710683
MYASLTWAVKESLHTYIREVGGAVIPLQPAQVETGTATFPCEAAESNAGRTILKFMGGIRFIAHQGLLDVTVREPWLDISYSQNSFTISVTGNGVQSSDSGDRITIGRGELPSHFAASGESSDIEVLLTAEGATIFRYYPSGIRLAPLQLQRPPK